MDTLEPADIKSLIRHHGTWCVSLYMPAHRADREQQQAPIRLQNLLAEAETILLANGLRRSEVQKMMNSAEELLWDKEFWQNQGGGLAIFLAKDFEKVYSLLVGFEELLVIGNSFHIKALLPCVGRGSRFYFLTINLNNVRLFRGDASTLSEIELDFPTSLREALSTDDPENYLNAHVGSMSIGEAKGVRSVFHGHNITDDERKNILRFFQSINQGLNEMLEEKTIPMVLGGLEELLSMYRQASTYNNLLDEAIPGNLDQESLNDLHIKVWQIIKPRFEENQKKAHEKFEQLRGKRSALATSDLQEVIKAARVGQVETLFVPLRAHKWGRFDNEKNRVILRHESGEENQDLFDLAAADTILNSGQVFAVPTGQIPGDGEIAAVLRYTT